MKLYFSTNQIAELEPFSFAERQQIMAIASSKLTPLAKLILNLIKLAILIPPFMMLAYIDSWWFVLPLVGVLIGYMLILRPVSLLFLHKHIPSAIKVFKQQQQ
ncbi:DUF6170 family protein [Thalassotalea aquiviva]|uniref:DUF6170 family protein n=1 Tax=Thalassotalea aquiviva TaxID=3242415 RepID=UPI00352B92B5